VFQSQFLKFGGVIRDEETVKHLASDGSVVTVTTSKSTYTSQNVILAAGPWTLLLTETLGLRLPLEVNVQTSASWLMSHSKRNR